MEFSFTVTASVERSEGKFASRDELEEQLVEAIESADPGSLDGDAGGVYDVVDWSVSADAAPSGKPRNVNRDRLIAEDLRVCIATLTGQSPDGDQPDLRKVASKLRDVLGMVTK